jgi:chromosome segregation ATPase
MPETNVERTLGLILGRLGGIEDRLEHADESRSALHKEVNQLVLRTTQLESDIHSTKTKVEAVQKVTDDVKVLRDRAAGAGTAGTWLLRIGIAIITGAGWAAAAYTWLTGRPPP